MNRALDGSCHVPVAAYACEAPAGLHLRGLVGGAADGRIVRAEAVMAVEASVARPKDLVRLEAAVAGQFGGITDRESLHAASMHRPDVRGR